MKPSETQIKIHENRICSMVGHELMKHYAGWEWYVDCKLMSGVVSVRNISLNGDYGFYIPLNKLLNETEPRLVKMAGGEILERYNMDRNFRREYDIQRDFTGSAIGDTDGVK